MSPTAEIGLAMTLLELTATAIGCGIVVGGFVASAVGMLTGQSRKELEDGALRQGFWGGVLGIFCLCYDLLTR